MFKNIILKDVKLNIKNFFVKCLKIYLKMLNWMLKNFFSIKCLKMLYKKNVKLKVKKLLYEHSYVF